MATPVIDPRTRENDEPKRGMGRRGFLATAASGLSLGFFLEELSRVPELNASTAIPGLVNTWLTISPANVVTLTIGASEMGQGSFSGLAQILAEELMVDYPSIVTAQGAPSLASPQPVGASINTVGSGVTRNNYWALRKAGASAREALVQAAMNLNAQGDLNRAHYTVNKGIITHTPTGTTYSYGSVADAASALPLNPNPPLTPDSQFQLIGKTQARFDIPAKVDGSAKYGIDIRIPGMVYGIVKHGPCFGATLSNTPTARNGMQVIPVKVIAGTGRGTEVTGATNAFVVTGPTTWDAWQAVNGVRATWTLPANQAALNSAQFISDGQALLTSATPYVAGAANGPGTLYTVEGNAATANTAISGAAKSVDVQYTLPYVAHATMEVLNCTVNYIAGQSCEIWAPTQNGKGVLSLAVQITGLAASQITVHTTYLGGGLGRKAEVDFVSQAIQAAMVVGKPIKLMYTREQDFTRDQYRPMAVVHGKAGVDSAGNIVGWAYRNVSPSILGQRGVPLGPTGDSQGIEGAQKLPYNFGTRATEWVSHTSPIPVGFWRSVGASINTFCVESLMDELAALAGQDPYMFRRSKLTDPRWIAVLDAAATLGKWNIPAQAGHFRGIAIGTAFNTIVAEVVEISSVTATSLRVNSVSVAIDVYRPVNPGQIEAQIQGGIVHGMNAALYGQQTFVNGTAQATNFSHSRMIKMGEMPSIALTIMPAGAGDPTVAIGGVGELGVPAFAPALANAYFKATGKRQRSLPFFPGATMSD